MWLQANVLLFKTKKIRGISCFKERKARNLLVLKESVLRCLLLRLKLGLFQLVSKSSVPRFSRWQRLCVALLESQRLRCKRFVEGEKSALACFRCSFFPLHSAFVFLTEEVKCPGPRTFNIHPPGAL